MRAGGATKGWWCFCMQVTRVVGAQLLDLLEASSAGGLLGEGHSWVAPAQAPTSTHPKVKQAPLVKLEFSLSPSL